MRKTEKGTGFQGKIKSLLIHVIDIAKWRSQADSGIYFLGGRSGFQIYMSIVSIEMTLKAMRGLKQSEEKGRESLTEFQGNQTLEVG